MGIMVGQGDFEFFEGMLPEVYRSQLKRLMIFTLAQQVQKVAELRDELETLARDEQQLQAMHDAGFGSW